ncbi:hypothetical protein H8S90_03390 [Olivibacter sp. SDN3]|uniref:DUF5684 domain-containing protein n=1 Tax=Olivibacter sp. SDN3 TaxID=2764720 RepID=UPI00165164CE|nr:DUF5684 domain-containing protein [Olivibacter sp. SDN3]QNL50658.1 hypothetical protein H8S90_03390 [Olivibacter sp. SDN3]
MDNYNYGDSMSSGLLAGIGVVGMLIYLAIIVLTVAGLWKMFEKAGKPGWAAIIPIYNVIIMLEIVGKPLWWIIGLFIPCVNVVVLIWVTNLLMKSFGKDTVYTVLVILFPFIIYPMIGFGSDQYQGPSAAEARGQNSFNQFKNYKNPFDEENEPPKDPTV